MANNETCKSNVCKHCYQPREAHSKIGAECPTVDEKRFQAEVTPVPRWAIRGCVDPDCMCYADARMDEDGGWVKHDDHLAEIARLTKSLEEAQAEIDFWQRELDNFRRNAVHRARQMAAEVLRGDVEQLVKPWREAAERYAAMTPAPAISLDTQLLARAEAAKAEVNRLREALGDIRITADCGATIGFSADACMHIRGKVDDLLAPTGGSKNP